MVVNISIIGLGKLGLALAALAASKNHQVGGIDKEHSRLLKISENQVENEPDLKKLLFHENENLNFSTDFKLVQKAELILIVVPTPSKETGEFDDSIVLKALEDVLSSITPECDSEICIVSTIMPGTCSKIQTIIRQKGFYRISVSYSPEFIAIGTILENLRKPEFILVGHDINYQSKSAMNFFKSISENNPPMFYTSLESAEIAKIALNSFITTKISFANMIAEISDNTPNANAHEIMKIIGTDRRIGSRGITPGLGFGGPCFPRDNKALVTYSESIGVDANIAVASHSINEKQPNIQLARVLNKININSPIAFLGLTYKSDVPIFEESHACKLVNLLFHSGLELYVHDPYYENMPDGILNAQINVLMNLHNLDKFSQIIIAVNHKNYYELLNNKSYKSKIIII